MILTNMEKAKEITKDRLRTEREPLMAVLDVQYLRNQEAGTDNTAVIAEKQRLRNITKLADGCATTDELKALSCN